MEPSDRPITVCHLITSSGAGGAERQLCALIAAGDPDRVRHRVICLGGPGELAGELEAAGAAVTHLGLAPRPWHLWRAVRRVRARLHAEEPDLVQSWLYHADLAAALAAGRRPLVWTLRCADMDLSRYRGSTRLVLRACVALSRRPRAIVANSRAGRRWHQGLGYPAGRLRVIPNGFDLERFRPDPRARARLRAGLGVSDDQLLVGRVARDDPMKDLPTFLDAARLAARRRPELCFLLVGRGMEAEAPVAAAFRQPPLAGRCFLVGHQQEVAPWLAAMDLHLSSSLSEGLPNAVGEAMACGVPNLVTDAGDSAWLVGDTGRVVPPGQPFALASALEELARLPREELRRLGEEARRRIAGHFSLEAMARAYLALYREILSTSSRSTTKGQERPPQERQTSSTS